MRRGEGNGGAGLGIVERLDDRAVIALIAVDLAPGHGDAAEIGSQSIDRLAQCRQLLRVGRAGGHIVHGRQARFLGGRSHRLPQRLAPEDRERGLGRGQTPFIVPAAQALHRIGQRRIGRPVLGRDQARNQPGEAGQIGIIGSADQAIEGEMRIGRQHDLGMGTARILAGLVHVAGKGLALRAVRAGRRPGPVIGVHRPAALGVYRLGQAGQVMQAAPVGRRIAAVHGLRIIEAIVADRHELRVEISDLALVVGQQRVVAAVRLILRDLEEARIVAGLGAQIALFQRRHRLVHQREGDPLVALGPHDRAVMGGVAGEGALGELAVFGTVGNGDGLFGDRAQFLAIAVEETIALRHDRLGKFIDIVDAARRVHPADMAVEALIDEELAPGDRAIGVQSLVAAHLQFGPEEEAGVRVDHQQRMAAFRPRRRDGEAVRPLRLAIGKALFQHGQRHRLLLVKGL